MIGLDEWLFEPEESQVWFRRPEMSLVAQAMEGKKTHIGVAIAMFVVTLNHFQLLPEWLRPDDLDPKTWMTDMLKLYFISTGRAAISTMRR